MDYETLGPYVLKEELGRGAMARVWRAWDPRLRREVAIKEPLYDARYSQTVLEEMGNRFVAEGRAAAQLSHPGIVTIYEADVWDGHPAIVMELITGETLGKILSRGPMAPAQVLAVLDQLLDAVGYAHARGVIHRDIKPDNIFVTSEGRVKLTDFGIARIDGSMTTLGTVSGAVLGTPGYMSPEQARGITVDARSDLFSVGTVAYEMLSGQNPFGAGQGADAMTLIYRIVHESVPELPPSASAGLPADLRPAIMAALSKKPEDRPQSASDFIAMLHGQMDTFGARGTTTDDAKSVVDSPLSTIELPGRPDAGGVPTQGSADASLPTVRRPLPRTSLDTNDDGKASEQSWLPYIILSAVALAILGFVFVNAVRSTNPADNAAVDVDTNSNSNLVGSSSDAQAAAFPLEWDGTYEGLSDNGDVSLNTIRISLMDVTEAGKLSGICEIGIDESKSGEGCGGYYIQGSYYVEGFIDWSSGSIELHFTSWLYKGELGNKRHYMGTYSEISRTIFGSTELMGGGTSGTWEMSAS